MVNATILLMRLECKRFTKVKELAWRTDNVFTSRGEMEHNETFEGISYRYFNLAIEEKEDRHEDTTSRRCKPNKMFYVVIPKEATKGSYFGHCSCGVDMRDAVLCEHMAAIVTSTRIPVLTRTNIMPHWWTCNTWQLQFPIEEEPVCNVNLAEIKSSKNHNNFIRYCPLWSAPNKAGRPKKGERRKSGIEAAMGKKREGGGSPVLKLQWARNVKSRDISSGCTVRFVQSTTTQQRTAGRIPSMHISALTVRKMRKN